MRQMSKIQRIGDLEKKYVLDVLNGEFKSSLSSTYMKKFESAFAARYEKNLPLVVSMVQLQSAIS